MKHILSTVIMALSVSFGLGSEKYDASPTAVSAHGLSPHFAPPNYRRNTDKQIEIVRGDMLFSADHYGEKAKINIDPPPLIRTPKPNPYPRINGAGIVGIRPGNPMIFTVPVSGQRPMTIEADSLPDGLHLDSNTGIITGSCMTIGEYSVTITASNGLGVNRRRLRIIVGDRIALTPPMGWNSWNCFGLDINSERIQAIAQAFVDTGLRDHGWQYVVIDNGWTVNGEYGDDVINPKFPNMKRLTDSIHELGLKAGIHARWQKDEQSDAELFSKWGFDYLKYLHGFDRESFSRMGNELKRQQRDIIYSICSFGQNKVWEWGASVNGNCWRTSGDISDTWRNITSRFPSADWSMYSEPSHWNDPDMMVVGMLGWGGGLRPTRLTPDEQYTHMTLWSLMAAPLMLGCDLTQIDDFTLGLLTNDEVIAVNQDPLGYAARRIPNSQNAEIHSKLLEDGSRAIGFFNINDDRKTIAVHWRDLDLIGPQKARDIWQQKDLGHLPDGFQIDLPPHGCFLIKVSPDTPPVTPASPPTISGISSAMPTISGAAISGSTITIYDNASTIATVVADGNGNWVWIPPIPLAVGTHLINYSVTATGVTSGNSPTAIVTVPLVTNHQLTSSGDDDGGGRCGVGGSFAFIIGAMFLGLRLFIRQR